MSEDLRWSLEFDSKSNALRVTAGDLRAVNVEVVNVRASILRLDGGMRGMNTRFDETGRAARTASSHFEGFGASLKVAAGAAGTLLAALSAGVLALDKFGDKAITAFGERQGSLRAYTTLLGSAANAEREFGKAQALALRTDLTSKEVEGAQKKLMVAGFRNTGSDKGLDRALLATTDVASMAAPEDRQMTMDRVGKGFSDIRSKGKLQGEELKQLSEAGLSRGLIVAEVAKAMHLKDNASAEKAISKGSVSADVGINSIERAVLAQFGTKRLGDFSTGSAGSLTSMISNRDESAQNLMKGFDGEQLPGTKALKDSLRDLNESLSTDSESGKNLSLTLQHLGSESLNLKGVMTDFTEGFVRSFGESYVGTLKAMGVNLDESQGKWDSSGMAAKTLGETVGKVGDAAARAVTFLDRLESGIDSVAYALEKVVRPFEHLAEIRLGHPIDTGRALYAAARESAQGSRDLAAGAPGDPGRDRKLLMRHGSSEYGGEGGAGKGGGSGANGVGLLAPQMENYGKYRIKGAKAAKKTRTGKGGGGNARADRGYDWGFGSGDGDSDAPSGPTAREALTGEMMASVDRIQPSGRAAAEDGDGGGVSVAPGAVVININGVGKDAREIADLVDHSIDDFFMRRIGRYTHNPRASRV